MGLDMYLYSVKRVSDETINNIKNNIKSGNKYSDIVDEFYYLEFSETEQKFIIEGKENVKSIVQEIEIPTECLNYQRAFEDKYPNKKFDDYNLGGYHFDQYAITRFLYNKYTNDRLDLVITDIDRIKYTDINNIKFFVWEEDEVKYWRKANQIREWFVKNTNYSTDNDCQYHKLKKNDLELLVSDCKKVLDNHDLAEVLLPTKSGFFFGSTEYDDWYFDTIEETYNDVKRILNTFDFENRDIYYYESW